MHYNTKCCNRFLSLNCFVKLSIIVVLINNKEKYLWMLYKMNYILSISVVIMLNILLIIFISIIKLWYSYILLSWNKYSI